MKTKLLRFSKRSLAMLLSLLMMLSVLSVGSIITTAAADTITLYYQKDMPSGNYSASSSKAMTQSAKNTSKYYASVSLQNGSYGFYVKWGNDYYKVSATATTDRDVLLYNYGSTNYGNSNHRVTYSTGAATTFTFTFDTSNNKICVRPRASTTVKIAWSTASGHDGDWNLGTYDTMTHTSDGLYTKDLTLTAVKHYMFIQTNNNNYYRSSNTLTQNSSASDKVAKMYYYGTDNYGGSGDKVNFTPSAAGKYRFTYDIKDQTVTMYRLYDVTYNKGTAPSGGGAISGTAPSAQLKVHGTNLTLATNAFTSTGYTQSGWATSDGGSQAYTSGASYSTNSGLTLYPYWSENTYSVTVSAGTGGTVSTSSVTAGCATKPSITATANDGYQFSSWSVSGGASVTSSTSATTTVSATAAGTVTANFTKKSYTVKKTETGASTAGTVKVGSTTITTGGVSIEHGSYTVTVTAPTGYNVSAVSGISGTTSGLNTDSVTITGVSITAAKTIAVTYVSAGTCAFDLSKSSTTLNIGGTDTFTATPNGYHSSGTISASSSDTSVATVSKSGNTYTVTAVAPGTATITVSCTDTGNVSSTFNVTVNEPTISVDNNSTLLVGGTYTPEPTLTNPSSTGSGWSVVYTRTSGTSASVSGSTITGESGGSATTFKASYQYNGVEKASTTFTVTPKTPSISAFSYASAITIGSASAAPTVTASNCGSLTKSFAITSGSDYATINSSTGVVTGRKAGAVTVTVYYKKGSTTIVSKTANITVSTPTVAFADTSAATINIGGTVTRAASNKSTVGTVTSDTTTYSSSDTAVATVSSSGVITGVTPGSATISATRTIVCDGKTTEVTTSTNVSVTVRTPSITQGNVTMAKGDSKTLSTSTTNPSSGLTVTFALSGSPNGVTCTSAGVVTVAQNSTASTATVVATAKNSGGTTVATKSITVTIETPTLTVKDGSTSVADGTVYTTVGTNKALTVGQNFSGDLTAKSANTSIATVSLNNGALTITPKAKGTTKVSVSTDSGYTPTNAPAALLSASPLLLLGATPSVATQTVEFTVNVAETDTYKYLYFTKGVDWSGVNAYLYGDGNNASFPGEAMVKIGKNEENKDVYAIRYPATKNYTNVIISKDGEDGTRIKYNNTTNLPMPSNGNNAYWASDTNGNAGQWNCTIVKPQIQANDVTIDMGSTQTMTATVLNNVTPSTFNWSSGTTSIATVANTHTASNVISGVAPGTSTITIKAYAAKPTNWNSIVTDGTADDYVAGTTTATATVVAENKTVTFGAKKTDDGSTFTDLSGAVTAKYYDADTSGSGSSGSGSGSDPEPAGGPYYLHIGRQNDFVTNEAIEFTWNGSYYYAEYTVETANTDYPFVINTKNTALGDSDKSASSQAVTTRAANYDPDNIYNNVFNYLGDYNTYSGYGAFKIIAKNANTKIYITFASTSAGVVYRSSITSSSGSSGGSSGSSGTSGDGTTMTSPASVPYGKVAKFTAEATKTVSDVTYHFAEWVDGSGNKLSSDNPYSITVTADKTVYARYYRVYKLSAFDSYTSDGTNVNFVTSPPKVITVKHGDETFIYTYDGTEETGNPDSPDGDKVAALPIASGTYGQGNYIQYYAGDEITLYYSAMASSEIFKGVFYNNSANYYVAKPTQAQYVAHDYSAGKTLYMNSSYYTTVPSGLPSTTVDHDAHSIKFTGIQDYKNIDIEIANKRKVYFSDYTNAVIGSKNTDDYYYDGEALSVTGDQLTVKAAGNASQTNSINKNNVKVYRADANGQPTGDPLSGYTVSYDSGTDPVTNSGATASTRYIIISGNMPSYDLYIDLGITSSYTIKLGSKISSDSFENKTRLAEVATVTITGGSSTLTAPNNADITSTSASVNSSTALTLSSTFTGSWGDYYMFVGWYWGSDTAPDFDKGFISDKASLSYTPKKGGTIWAVGTRNLYINGSKYITGKDNNWYGENNVQKNLPMSFDAESGRYYWEISDTMFAAAGYNYKTWKEENSSATTEYGRYHTGDDQNLYWYSTDDKYHGKAFFQLFDQESGNANKTIWDQITYFVVDEPANGPTYGKVYPPEGTYTEKQHNGQGFINFNESGSYAGQSSPLRIYFDPSKSGNARLTVEATKVYSNLYVSNGYTVGSTLKTSAVTVEPVVDGVVKSSGQTGYFDVGQQGTGWNPDVEGHVNHYRPQKKGATVRITKTAGGNDKISAFFIYDITNKTVRAERDVKKDGSKYYIDLTLANSEQNLYIVPIVEEDGANVTVTFDATQLNRKQWGDIVTAYAWYQNNGGAALGDYPGQPMIPSDDMTTWTAKFKGVKSSNELEGITFSNYVDGAHSWLGCSDVMSSVTYGGAGTASNPTTVTFGDNGLIKQYNYIESGTNKEYSRGNFKAQTYDYREPIALYDRFKSSDNVSISFSMKDGNSSLLSWRHSELLNHNIVTLEPDPSWSKLNWEYLTNAKGDKYIDLNGNTMKTKPTASFYIAAKGQVLYNNSSMTNVFYSGKSYDGISGVTYGGAAGVSMNYAVQWYVYDASGNYITNVLTAGIADMSSNNVDSYIGKVLEDKGYAVDGKSVAICYDKPRYMYGDAESGSGATGYNGKRINVGNDFDAYRFTGQWNAVASNELVKVNVGVGMMTDSGEVLASSNTAGYGNASASYDTTKGNNAHVTNEDGDNAPFTASDGSFVRTAVRDAENSPVKLNASSQNFIGWYYYDANTGDFVKANYASNENFYPNYSNKDVTFYAMYRASAVYQYKYRGREYKDGDDTTLRTYSASGNDLSEYEMGHSSVIRPADHEADIKLKVPVGIGVFKKNIDFTATNYDSWTKTPDNNGYVLDITGFATSLPTYTLTVHYKDASGNPVTITDSAVYNDKAVDLTSGSYTDSKSNTKPAGTAVTTYYGTQQHKFLGWYEYKNGETGDLLSTQANYGLRLTRKQEIIAVYDENNHALPSGDNWSVHIDENEVNKELTTVDTGVFYNDTIVRVRKGADVKATLPSGAKIGVLVVCDNKTGNSINNYNSTQLTTLANAVTVGKTKTTGSGLSITNMQAAKQTSFNRTDLAARRDYKSSLGAKYCVYAYIYDGSSYTFSEVSDVKTYE